MRIVTVHTRNSAYACRLVLVRTRPHPVEGTWHKYWLTAPHNTTSYFVPAVVNYVIMTSQPHHLVQYDGVLREGSQGTGSRIGRANSTVKVQRCVQVFTSVYI